MQGKSCFNFTGVDHALLAELEQLTRTGYERTAGSQAWALPSGSSMGWRTGVPGADSRARDLAAVEARIWGLLEPHRRRGLVDSTIRDAVPRGCRPLAWPGAKAHDYFAAVKAASRNVSLFLLVADTYPEALEERRPSC